MNFLDELELELRVEVQTPPLSPFRPSDHDIRSLQLANPVRGQPYTRPCLSETLSSPLGTPKCATSIEGLSALSRRTCVWGACVAIILRSL